MGFGVSCQELRDATTGLDLLATGLKMLATGLRLLVTGLKMLVTGLNLLTTGLTILVTVLKLVLPARTLLADTLWRGSAIGTVLNLRTNPSQNCEAIPRRARI